MPKKGIARIFDAFEDRRGVILAGIFSYYYLAAALILKSPLLPNVLPPLTPKALCGFAAVVFFIQVVVWKIFNLFEKRNFKQPSAWLLFFCEFGILLLAASFVSWPVFWVAAQMPSG